MGLSTVNSIRWVEPFNYQSGKPFKVMPLGTYKRGARTLTLTPERLKAMAENYAAGRPRWKIPIYFGHPTDAMPDPPKVGNITKLDYRDGEGLFAVPEYTPDGEKAVADGAYQFVSPGVLWDLAGGEYVDEQGGKFNNVIDHIALTNKPYFGAQTQLFSALALEDEEFAMNPFQNNNPAGGNPAADAQASPMQKVMALMKQAMAAMASMMPQEQGQPPAQQQPPQLQAAAKPAGFSAANTTGTVDMLADIESKEKLSMSDNKNEKPEGFTVTAEQFAALEAKAAQADKFAAELADVKKQADTFAADLAKAKHDRRYDQLKARADQFMAVPEKPETLAEKMLALEEKDADLFTYFTGLLEKLDKAAVEAGLFSQIASERAGDNADTMESVTAHILKEQFGGDAAKYGEAMIVAADTRPELFGEYKLRPTARK